MSSGPEPLTAAELQALVARADPDAMIVPPRVLRRAIKAGRKIGGLGLRVPHRHLYFIRRDDLLAVATPDELGGKELPETALLLPLPSEEEMSEGRGVVLGRMWRLLYHAAAHRAFSRLGPEDIGRRITELGDAFAEARAVLGQDQMLLAEDDATVLQEFAAVYLELRAFDEDRLAFTFPACPPALGDGVFGCGLDLEQMRERCRPDGAEMPPREEPPAAADASNDEAEVQGESGVLQRRAAEEAKRGNLVRAAIMLRRAELDAPKTQAGPLQGAAKSRLSALVGRLLKALHLPLEERGPWMAGLTALLEPASRGYWNREARLLYDIQRACHSLERPTFAADLVEPVVTLFQRPVRRPLPDVPLVLGVKYVRKALARLPDARIPDQNRDGLLALLHEAEHELTHRLREGLRPKITAALDEAGLVPHGKAEGLSRRQLVEELLDQIDARGQISLPDLRDAVARSRVGLPDLGPLDLVRGDPLLRANEALARNLDGVYRRGEAYLRLMQVASSLFFGNVVGRLLTLYVLLPVLAALFTVLGVDALVGEAMHVPAWLSGQHKEKSHDFKMNLFDIKHEAGVHALLAALVAAAVFYLLVIHVPPFRSAVGRVLYWLWQLIRGVLWDAPAFVLGLPAVQAVLGSAPAQLFWRFVGRPLMWTAPLALLLWLCFVPPFWVGVVSAAVFVLLAVAMNTRAGYLIEEAAADSVARGWILLRDDFLLGAWSFIVWFFRWLTDRISAWMYSVDERLRFREGESSFAFAGKCVIGLFWFAISYLIRFVWLLFIEPQINPIKHFPVVTVGHKLSLLLIPTVAATGLGVGWATFILGLVPGVYGFIAWELKENWKLYRANLSPTIDPDIVGGHGEWVVNYVRPGFHSGTLPVLFARLRNSEGPARLHHEEGLHHVGAELRRFVQRALLLPLAAAREWGEGDVPAVGQIALATSRIRVKLTCLGLGEKSAWIEFKNDGGRLAARLTEPGWTAGLQGGRLEAWDEMLSAFYARAGVEGVRKEWAAHAAWWERDGGLA
jgi:hypothetical protein